MTVAVGRPDPIPLTVLTGFLGAGKTTLLNRLLRDPALADTLVVVNEFGEVGIDHLLVETADDDLVLLAAGCLCCTVRGDLVATLEELLRRRDNGRVVPFRRVVIETTGLADPAPVLAAILYHPYLSIRYAVEGVVTVVDAPHGEATLDRHEEARRQVAVADRIVVTKADLADEAGRASLEGRLRRLNPAAPVRIAYPGGGSPSPGSDGGASEPTSPHRGEGLGVRAATPLPIGERSSAAEPRPGEGGPPAGWVIGSGLFGLDGKIGDVATWLGTERDVAQHGHHHGHAHDPNRHDERIHSFVLTTEGPMRRGALDMFLDLARSTFGPRILRLKGLVALDDDPDRPVVIQGVRHVLHVPATLPAWPSGDRRSRIVFIVDDVPAEPIVKLWNAFTGLPMVDGPDATALADNPLAPPTMAARR